jgi:hypothetical protein
MVAKSIKINSETCSIYLKMKIAGSLEEGKCDEKGHTVVSKIHIFYVILGSVSIHLVVGIL